MLSQPNITSNDNQQGTVEIVTEVPLPSTTTGTGGTTGSSVEFKPVGIRLLVTPRISWAEPTNQIEMTIQTEVSAVDFGPTRLRNRCELTGRARGTFRMFGLGRSKIRDLAFKGDIPGVVKASW